MGYEIEQGNLTEPLSFRMLLSSDHVSPALGLTPNVYLSKNAYPFVAAQGAISEVGNGWYSVAPNADDADTIGTLLLYATALGADATADSFDVVAPAVPAAPVLPGDAIQTNALRIIRTALRTIGKLAQGEPVQGDVAQDAHDTLNEMLDNWRTQKLLVPQLTRVSLELTPGKTVYTVGPGGDLDIARPYGVRYAFVVDTNSPNMERAIDVLSEDALARRPYKAMLESGVTAVYYTPSHPLGTITIPATSGSSVLVLYVLTGLPRFDDLETDYILLPGYLKAIRYNLALQLAPFYGVQADGFVHDQARNAIGDIKRLNIRHHVLANYFMQRGGDYNIYNDEIIR